MGHPAWTLLRPRPPGPQLVHRRRTLTADDSHNLPPDSFMFEGQTTDGRSAERRADRPGNGRLTAARDRVSPRGRTARSRSGWTIASTGALLLGVASCGGESGPNSGSGADMKLNEVGNGFGQLLPHRVNEITADGNDTGQVVSIRSLDDISTFVRRTNPILPSDTFREGAIEPDGTPGNHYLFANFTQAVDVSSVLSSSPTGGGALSGAISVTTLNPLSGASLAARGRVFIGGRTFVPPASGAGEFELMQWVRFNRDTGRLEVALDPSDPNEAQFIPQALEFPGVGTPDPQLQILASPNTVVFVRDTDNTLATREAFPSGVQVRMKISRALRSVGGENLQDQALAASTVGVDDLPPEFVLISPNDGDTGVDPTTPIRIEFTEPVQPHSVGPIGNSGVPPGVSSALSVMFGPTTSVTEMPFTVLPVSPYDLSTVEITPAFAFPGTGPQFQECDTFFRVTVGLTNNQVEDLSQVPNPDPNQVGQFLPNRNQNGASAVFDTGEGPSIVNAPVLPDAIYVGRGGAVPGLSVLDLNGYGQSSGNPITQQPVPLRGQSRFIYDPNVSLNPNVRPPLVPGQCTIDGGSAGVFTLTLDGSLEDLVLRAPLVSLVTDVHAGHALDGTLRNAPFPVGCQVQGGYICASDGLKVISAVAGNQPNTLAPSLQNQFGALNPGYENIISWAPHPNPPRVNFPPICVSPFLAGQEPTSVDVTQNLLVTGDPFPRPNLNRPPSGLLTLEQNQFFLGPTVGAALIGQCSQYQIRQQVGHFLYIADRPRNEIVVVNSNRMTVIERIEVPDPTSMAMGPNIDLLAISNQLSDTVTFVDVNPQSAQFHQIIQTVEVGNSPRGIAFEPTNEDCIVCNELDSSLSIIGAAALQVRRTINSQLNRPFELAITPRMIGFAFQRGVYFAYILNRSGSIALFESGPNGLNGFGFDDVIGIIPFTFQAPKTIQLDPINLDASVYVVHEGPIDVENGQPGNIGEGAISRVRIESGPNGVVPISGINIGNPNFRDSQFSVPLSISQATGQLSGIPVDIAFDNQRNVGGLPGPLNQFSAGAPIPANNKSQIRVVNGVVRNASTPQFLFASVPNPVGSEGVVDVLALGQTGTPRFDTDPYIDGVQSVPVNLVTLLSDYFRQ